MHPIFFWSGLCPHSVAMTIRFRICRIFYYLSELNEYHKICHIFIKCGRLLSLQYVILELKIPVEIYITQTPCKVSYPQVEDKYVH
jgi:hypothetical protein